MAKNFNEAVSELKSYMISSGDAWKDWYVGIAADARKRLFNDHAVNEKTDLWIYRQCINSTFARQVEDYFVDSLVTKGDKGGGDDSTVYVYAYKISSHSRE